MAAEASPLSSRPSTKKHRRKRPQLDPEFERLDSLPWNPALPDEDSFSLVVGTNELEGGFLSLEEIGEAEYGVDIPQPEVGNRKEKKAKQSTKLKKRKRGDDDSSSGESKAEEEMVEEAKVGERMEKDVNVKTKKKKKNKKKKKPNDKENEMQTDEELPAVSNSMEDVFGAAETGSGKTLAFGLPILQRLLEERDKTAKMPEQKGEEAEKFSPEGLLRALIITPTRELALQVTDHLKAVATGTDIRVVPIVGGMSTEKQERLLKKRPEIVVGTPGRLWELISGGEKHLVELHSLSFFVLDEADRMIENGHFRELQSITDMLPVTNGPIEDHSQNTQNCVTVSSFQRKKRQTLVFSATIALSADFRKKLKRGFVKPKQSLTDGLNSIEALSERAGMRANVAIIDLTNASILADKIEESFIECREEDKDAYLYYILSVHGEGRTIVFCTSIAALRHLSSLLRILGINVWTLHAQMQQRARLQALDRFRGNEHGILVATDVAARGLDIPGVRTVVHYQLPHSADVYVHRSGRTARAFADGCSIALISPNETSKFASLCKSFSKESFQRFPLENSYIPEVLKRLSLARQIDKILRKDSQEKANKGWLERSAESVELVMDNYDSEEERVNNFKQKKATSMQLKKLQQELNMLLSRPLQPRTFSHRYLAGAGVSPLLQHQFEELARQKLGDSEGSGENKRRKLVIIGQNCVEPLQALRSAGHEVHMDVKGVAEKRRNMDNLRRKRKEEKKRVRDQRRKQRKKLKMGGE
ncbi:hypothetical protein I3843_01G167300 [Carya illinoinensis]|uniref:DEAD-box ATP-dependent RNA helicase 13 n=1 Tax=Carya illinoinensis TaxID=32201 RepID=A0A922G1L0_CARIL|nr:hypothetical protein I3842_01G175100 [Carya illinoinensis]KAG7996579.1 hypothetical protein I3843_01G167300 [Carya illinoinensis]